MIAGRRQPAAVHALAAALNAALDNVGHRHLRGAGVDGSARRIRALTTLAQEIAAGQVETLVITARNPAYSAPADLKFDKLLARVPTTIYHSLYEDETAAGVHRSSSRPPIRSSRGAMAAPPTARSASSSR